MLASLLDDCPNCVLPIRSTGAVGVVVEKQGGKPVFKCRFLRIRAEKGNRTDPFGIMAGLLCPSVRAEEGLRSFDQGLGEVSYLGEVS